MNALKQKNGSGKVLAVALLITLVFVAGLVTGRYVVSSPGLAKSETVSEFVGMEDASYIIFKEGSVYYAKDTNGQIPSWGESTNASQIIKNALGSGQVNIHITAGEYEISNTIILPEHVTISGAGKGTDTGDGVTPSSPYGTTILTYRSDSGPMFQGVNRPDHTDAVVLKDFTIDMGNTGSYGIDFGAVRRGFIVNVRVMNSTTHGFYIVAINGGQGAHQVTLINCQADFNGGDGFYVGNEGGGLSTANDVNFFSCRAYYNTGNGFFLNSGTAKVFGGETSGNDWGFILEGDRVYIFGARSEGDSSGGYNITVNSDRSQIYGVRGSITNNGTNTVFMSGATFTVQGIITNLIQGNIDHTSYLEIDGLRESSGLAIRIRTYNDVGSLVERIGILGYENVTEVYITNAYFKPYNLAHPSTAGWGGSESGRMWFCTTHSAIEYWNGSTIVTP